MTNILGLQEAPDLEFEANYSLAEYTKIAAMDDKDYWFNLELILLPFKPVIDRNS